MNPEYEELCLAYRSIASSDEDESNITPDIPWWQDWWFFCCCFYCHSIEQKNTNISWSNK
jgi:hypothetical protein